MLTKEECTKALDNITLEVSTMDNEDTRLIESNVDEEINLLDDLIKEHFDNPPLKFEELEDNMWVWDSYFHCYCYIGLIVNKNCVHIGYIDGYSSDGPFEENRFYRKEAKDDVG